MRIQPMILGLVMAGSLALLACSQKSADDTNSPASLKLYTLDCGSIQVSDLDSFSSTDEYAGQAGNLTNTCYLVRHPQGDLLWDLGLPSALAGAGPQTNDIFTLTLETTLPEQLSAINVAASDIDFVAISHSHFDHTGQVSLFPEAQWLVNNDEYQYMFSTPENSAQNSGFAVLSKSLFTLSKDVFNDGTVVILGAPGHTPGHSVLQVNLPQTGPVLLTGDLYHRTQSRQLQLVPRFNSDEPQTRKSMQRFEALAKASGARVIIQHELEDINRLPKPPEFLQ